MISVFNFRRLISHLPFPSHAPTLAHVVLSFQLAGNCKTKETVFLKTVVIAKRQIIENHQCPNLVA